MRNILSIALSNLRRDLSTGAILLITVLIASALGNIGLLLMMCYNEFFDERSLAINSPAYLLVEEKQAFTEAQERYLDSYPGVVDIESESAIVFTAGIMFEQRSLLAELIVYDASVKRDLHHLVLEQGVLPAKSNEVCLPYVFATRGYEVGDEFSITLPNTVLTYEVSGFSEEIMLGSAFESIYKIYLSETGFEKLSTEYPDNYRGVRVQLDDPEKGRILNKDFNDEFFFHAGKTEADSMPLVSLDISTAKTKRTEMPIAASMILLLFSALIVVISLFLFWFRIHNGLEETLTKVAALKTIGYTGRQLRLATILQYGILILAGVLSGIGISYLLVPPVSQILDYQSAMKWQQSFDLRCFAIAFFSISLPLLVVTSVGSLRIQKLTIPTALRRGLSGHNFKRNYFSLSESRGPLFWLVSLKSLANYRWQTVVSIALIAALSTVLVIEMAVYENLRTNTQSLTDMMFGELPDARILASSPEGADEISRFIEEESYVRKHFYSQDVEVTIGGYRINNNVTDDFDLLEGSLPYVGRYPHSDDEICINGVLAESLSLEVGTAVDVTRGSRTAKYIIVGLIQTVQSNGLTAAMTTEGYRLISPDFMPTEVSVYLVDTNETEYFIKTISTGYSNIVSAVFNYKMAVNVQLVGYSDIFLRSALLLVVVTLFLAILLTYALLKGLILKRWRELVIQKALGFSTFNLMNQVALSIIPIAVLGFAIGEVMGIVLFNPIFVLLAESMGVVTASLPFPVGLTLGIFVIILALFYLYGLLIAWRIRKISTGTMITE